MNSDFARNVSTPDLDNYDEKGYWIGPVLFDADHIGALRIEINEIWHGKMDHPEVMENGFCELSLSKNPRRGFNVFLANDKLYKTVVNPIIGGIASRLMRSPSVRLWYNQI